MNSELPELDPPSAADEIGLRERGQFTSLLQ